MIKKTLYVATLALMLASCGEENQDKKTEKLDTANLTSLVMRNGIDVLHGEEEFESMTLEEVDVLAEPLNKDAFIYNKELAFVSQKNDLYNDDVEQLYTESDELHSDWELQAGETELSRLFKQTYHMSQTGDARFSAFNQHIMVDNFMKYLPDTYFGDTPFAIMPEHSELKLLNDDTLIGLPYAMLRENDMTGKQDLVVRVHAVSMAFQKAKDVQQEIANEVVTYNGLKTISLLENKKNTMAAMEEGTEKKTEEKIIRLLEKLNYQYVSEDLYYYTFDHIEDFQERDDLENDVSFIPNRLMLADMNYYELMPGEVMKFEFIVEGIDEQIYTPLSEDDFDMLQIGYDTFEGLNRGNVNTLVTGFYKFDPEDFGIYEE